jgi:Na+/proline symporter
MERYIRCREDLYFSADRRANRGQWFGFILAVSLIATGTYVTVQGHDVVGGIVFGTTVIGVLVVYVLRKEPKSTEQRPEAEQ